MFYEGALKPRETPSSYYYYSGMISFPTLSCVEKKGAFMHSIFYQVNVGRFAGVMHQSITQEEEEKMQDEKQLRLLTDESESTATTTPLLLSAADNNHDDEW